MTLKSTKFMDSISVRVSECSEISSPILKIKFQHKWIIDSQLSKCEETRIWWLSYIEGKGIVCRLCRMTTKLQPSNNSKL